MSDQPISFPYGPQYHDAPPRRYWPVVTIILLALNFIIFGLEIWAGGATNTNVLLDLGAAYGPYMRRGEYWRLVMPIFLHGGWWHVLGNNYTLFVLGPILERVYGYGRYALIYIASGIASSALSMTVSKNVAVGASGAIFGVAGAILVTGYFHHEIAPLLWGRSVRRRMRMLIVLIFLILLTFAYGLSVHGIDNWGHLGGLAGGVLLAFVIPPPRQTFVYGEAVEPPSQALIVVPLAIVALAMAAEASHYRTMQRMKGLLVEGARYEISHDNDRALQSYQQALRLDPRQEQPHEAMGTYYLRRKKYDEAIGEFREAIRLTEGDDDDARLDLGLAYQLKGDPQKAQQVFEAVLGRNPKSAEGRRMLAVSETQLADHYAEQKLYADAIKAYQQALRMAPDFSVAHNNLAWLYATCDDPHFRDPKAALQHAQRAVDLTEWKEGGFIDTLAEAHYANRDYQQAVEIQKKALALEPDNKELQEHLVRYRQAAEK